jgi:hypothetical protein
MLGRSSNVRWATLGAEINLSSYSLRLGNEAICSCILSVSVADASSAWSVPVLRGQDALDACPVQPLQAVEQGSLQ